MKTEKIIELGAKYVANTYGRNAVVFEKGEGANLVDTDGKRYLDFLSGLSVNNLGHCPPKVVRAIKRQAGKLMHTSNLYHIAEQNKLAKKLVKASFADRAFFCNSGAEANEAAVKLARKYAHGIGRGGEVLCTENSFHGRTIAMITATGQKKYQEGFEPLPEGFPKVAYGDLDAAKNAMNEKIAAIMVEPIQAEGGVNVAPAGYLQGLRDICDKHGALLIYDEVQTGMGRTGKLFGYQHDGVAPDIMSLAKSLGGGIPIGCMLAVEKAAKVFTPGSHASTFGGNPLACAAANAVMDIMTAKGFFENLSGTVDYLQETLQSLLKKIPGAKQLRGRGFLWGIEIEGEAAPIVKAALEKGLLIGSAGPNVVRFAPPLIITAGQIKTMESIVGEICETLKS